MRGVIELAYDRGVMMTFDIEKTSTGLAGMIVNGNGKDVPEGHATFENDKYKNYGLRLSQDVLHLSTDPKELIEIIAVDLYSQIRAHTRDQFIETHLDWLGKFILVAWNSTSNFFHFGY